MNLIGIASKIVKNNKSYFDEAIKDFSENSLHESLIVNPFPTSMVSVPVYHGSRSKNVNKLRRPNEGVWFAMTSGWVDDLYTADGKGEVLTCWINVVNPYYPTEDENYEYYGRMNIIGKFFQKLEKLGFDSYYQGMESESIAVFKNVEIINALTGENL